MHRGCGRIHSCFAIYHSVELGSGAFFVRFCQISMISGYVDLEAQKRNLDREYRSEINWPMNRI